MTAATLSSEDTVEYRHETVGDEAQAGGGDSEAINNFPVVS